MTTRRRRAGSETCEDPVQNDTVTPPVAVQSNNLLTQVNYLLFIEKNNCDLRI